MKAELEGVAKFWAPSDHVWNLDIKQGAGAEERHGVDVDPGDTLEVPHSKNATANFLIKFPGDKQHSYINVVELKPDKKGPVTRPQTADDTDMVAIAAFECRGCEPVSWNPTGGYCAETADGVLYDDVGFKDAEDWCEYDEKSGESMMIGHKIPHEFVLYRG